MATTAHTSPAPAARSSPSSPSPVATLTAGLYSTEGRSRGLRGLACHPWVTVSGSRFHVPETEGSFRLTELESLGWNDGRTASSTSYADAALSPAGSRSSIAAPTTCSPRTASSAARSRAPRARGGSPADLPVVGDWVAVAPGPSRGAGTIHAVSAPHAFTHSPRKTPLAGDGGAGAGRERRRRVPRHVAERGPQPAPARALPDARVGERRASP